MMNWNPKTSLRSLAVVLGASALLVPALAIAEQPEIDCMSLEESDQEQFYNLSGQAQQATEEGDFDSALSFSLQAMQMCTTDAFTEYTLARIYQIRNECGAAFYHLGRLNSRIKAITSEDKALGKAIKSHFAEAKEQCGNAVPLEITCASDDTMIQLVGAIDTPRACPVYTAIIPGAYQLNATKDKFFPHKDTLTVSENGLTYSVPALQDADDFGELRVKCPRGAIKFILTDPKGIVNEYACPWEGKLPSGTYKLRLGGADATQETEVVISKHTQTEQSLVNNAARANCSATPVSTSTGFGALLMAALGAFGLAALRRKRED